MCQLNLKWDENIPDEISNEWLTWKENLPNLEMAHLGRCAIQTPWIWKSSRLQLTSFLGRLQKRL